MHLKLTKHTTYTGLVCLLMSVIPARALVSLNDGKDKVYVTGKTVFGYDSNLYSSAGGAGDYTSRYSLSTDYSRRAGLIGVDVSVALEMGRYAKYTSENYLNPSYSLELTKQTGRTTGSLQFRAAKESRADSAANIRATSWEYFGGLDLKYPVIDRYSLSGGVSASRRDFTSTDVLVSSKSLTANVDLFYVYTTERDLFMGYRYRKEDSDIFTSNTDHAVYLGVSGRILPKLNGNLRFGYQLRDSHKNGNETFESWMSSASGTWNINKRMAVTGTLSKDFNTTSTDVSTDTLSGELSLTYSYSAKWTFGATTGAGNSKFLGAGSLNRVDTFFTYSINVSYTMNDHLKAVATYAFMHNWSTESIADFTRSSYTLSLSSKW